MAKKKAKKLSKLKKALAVLAALAALAGIGSGAKYYYEGRPYLVGKCFMLEDGTGLAIVKEIEGKDQEGKTHKAYLGVIMVGPFQLPQALKIREANKLIKQLLKEKKAEEVNCETGEPVSK